MKLVDLSGMKYGKLTVISRAEGKDKRRVYWLCKCECGKDAIVQSSQLRTGHTRSCGCLLDGSFNVTHGMAHTRLYRIWFSMKQRCTDPNSSGYHKYGAKGTKICSEWMTFKPFMKWAFDNGYSDELSIDRIDNSKGYSPDNCRFVTIMKQENNRTNNLYIEINGETRSLADWCRIFDIKYYAVQHRIHRNGMTPKDAVLYVKERKLKP